MYKFAIASPISTKDCLHRPQVEMTVNWTNTSVRSQPIWAERDSLMDSPYCTTSQSHVYVSYPVMCGKDGRVSQTVHAVPPLSQVMSVSHGHSMPYACVQNIQGGCVCKIILSSTTVCNKLKRNSQNSYCNCYC